MSSKESNYYTFHITSEQRDALVSHEHDLEGHKQILQPIRNAFDEYGFVLVRNLLDESLQKRICKASESLMNNTDKGKLFTSLEFGPVFNTEETSFREVAIKSAIPALVARVLLLDTDDDTDTTTLRLLKDAFMAKGKEEKHCGWHVDDQVFWPTDANSSGVNVWIALNDMPKKYGGGLAISPRSHRAKWREEGYEAIGSTPLLTPDGVTPEWLMKTFGRTCDIENLNKEVNDIIEASKLELDYEAGDCLFCKRWLYHRSVPVNALGQEYYTDDTTLSRYTIRYERGNARLLKGISLEPSVLMNTDNSGKTLDTICESDGPHYPQCWPPLDYGVQESKMDDMTKNILPLAQVKKTQLVKEMMAQAVKAKTDAYSS